MRLYVLDHLVFCGNEREVSMFAYTRIQPFLDKETKNNRNHWLTEIQAVLVDDTLPDFDKVAATKIGEQLKEMFVDNQNINLPLEALAFRMSYMEFEDSMTWIVQYDSENNRWTLKELFKK